MGSRQGSKNESARQGSKTRASFSARPADEIEEKLVHTKPRKLATNSGALVRSLTNEWGRVLQKIPFATRLFAERTLDSWSSVNCGQLIGFASQKGGRPGLPSQDEFAILHEDGYQFYVVVDGFGQCGETIAKFSRRWLREIAGPGRSTEWQSLVIW